MQQFADAQKRQVTHEAGAERPAMRILVIDDEENIRFALSMCLESEGHKIVSVGTIEAALEEVGKQAFDLIFLDVRLGTQNGLDYIKPLLQENPWARIVVITAYASIDTAVQAIRLGASDYLPKPFEHAQLKLLTQKVAQQRLLERKVEALQKILGSMDPEWDLPTSSRTWRESIELARRIASTNAPVLIRGEGGTGKGRLARAIHEWSGRAPGPFASISFEDRSATTLEAELFGAEGAGKVGAVAFCHGGTLLLDEVGQMPLALQPRVQALLSNKEFERQDSFARRPVDVRIIATTRSDLRAAVAAGTFREDLLMGLSVIEIDVPALRERPEDILLLAERYLAHMSREHHRPVAGFTRDAAFVLRTHTWPGNVRELRNAVERALLRCASNMIELEDLPVDLIMAAAREGDGAAHTYKIGDLVPLAVIEESHIRQVLASAMTIRRAAAILGVNASALCRKMKRLGPGANHDQSAP